MVLIRRGKFEGSNSVLHLLVATLPNIMFDRGSGGIWVGAPALTLGEDVSGWPASLNAFARKANAIIAISDPHISSISVAGDRSGR
jgi:hypothetical protein